MERAGVSDGWRHSLGGAPGERAGDVHLVRSFQEDDLSSYGVAVE
jgi:hypothetical protein